MSLKLLQIGSLLSAVLIPFCQATPEFQIQIATAPEEPSIINSSVDQTFVSDFTNLAVSNKAIPTTFTIDDKGLLRAVGDSIHAIRGTPGGDGQVGIFFDAGFPKSRNLECVLDKHDLTCTVGHFSVFVLCTFDDGTPDQIFMTKAGAAINSPCQLITLKGKTMG